MDKIVETITPNIPTIILIHDTVSSPPLPRINVVKNYKTTFGNVSSHKSNIEWGGGRFEDTNMALPGICSGDFSRFGNSTRDYKFKQLHILLKCMCKSKHALDGVVKFAGFLIHVLNKSRFLLIHLSLSAQLQIFCRNFDVTTASADLVAINNSRKNTCYFCREG